jgi:hypothetical protein
VSERQPDPAHDPLCKWSAWSNGQCQTCESIRLARDQTRRLEWTSEDYHSWREDMLAAIQAIPLGADHYPDWADSYEWSIAIAWYTNQITLEGAP